MTPEEIDRIARQTRAEHDKNPAEPWHRVFARAISGAYRVKIASLERELARAQHSAALRAGIIEQHGKERK